MTAEAHPHGPDELCAAGSDLYTRALREGRVPRQGAERAPCLTEHGLLYTDPDDARWLMPTPPAVALPQLLRLIQDNIARERRDGAELASRFQALMAHPADADTPPAVKSASVKELSGMPHIREVLNQALDGVRQELLIIQPGGTRPPDLLDKVLPRTQRILTRGVRMRTLYQHTTRHSLPTLRHYEQLDGDTEVRTLDELPRRLFVLDATVAFLPTGPDDDTALEVRHPAIIGHLVSIFERLWGLATPMYPRTELLPSGGGITPRQRAIAGLLIEGLTDAAIATRLGMNIRTARVHIAKLAATLGSGSRAQLGYLIGQSGILDHQP